MVLSLLIGAVQGIVGGVEKLDELNKELNSAAKGSNNNSTSKDKTCPHCGRPLKNIYYNVPIVIIILLKVKSYQEKLSHIEISIHRLLNHQHPIHMNLTEVITLKMI